MKFLKSLKDKISNRFKKCSVKNTIILSIGFIVLELIVCGWLAEDSRLLNLYHNLATEIGGATAIFWLLGQIIGGMDKKLEQTIEKMTKEKELKNQFLGMMSSTNNEVALRGVAELYARGWISDGFLEGKDLRYADLAGVVLKGFDDGDGIKPPKLRGVNLTKANLTGAVFLDGVDLSEAKLGWTDLSGAKLRSANLRGANLRGADLREANLSLADLREADLCRADLWDADLRDAGLRGADLWDAKLGGADLSGADLSIAKLGGADLSGADLRKAILDGADLDGADLRGAILHGVVLNDTRLDTKWQVVWEIVNEGAMKRDLSRTDLRDASLRGADLRDANLFEADLERADLRDADLSRAYLRDADLSDANLHKADLEGTIMPNGEIYTPGMDLSQFGAKGTPKGHDVETPGL